MFGDKFKRKYALSDKGVHNTKMGMLWTIVAVITFITISRATDRHICSRPFAP